MSKYPEVFRSGSHYMEFDDPLIHADGKVVPVSALVIEVTDDDNWPDDIVEVGAIALANGVVGYDARELFPDSATADRYRAWMRRIFNALEQDALERAKKPSHG